MDYNTHRMEICINCNKRFIDDCGSDFCSSSCENEFERVHAECEQCGDIVGEENLTHGICDNCIEE